MPKHSYTVDEILTAAEKDKYKNTNYSYVEYGEDEWGWATKDKIVAACVIGEAFLNLGLAENGTDASHLSHALLKVIPDDKVVVMEVEGHFSTYGSLSEFINDLNSYKGYRGKKRIPKLARKYFSKSLNQVVEF